MRFLVDNALSPLVSIGLSTEGHDAVHVRDLGMEAATDETIFAFATAERRIVISADTDFGTLLALRSERAPSVILFRRSVDRRPARQVALLLKNIKAIEHPLSDGAIAILEGSRIRIRRMPIGRD